MPPRVGRGCSYADVFTPKHKRYNPTLSYDAAFACTRRPLEVIQQKGIIFTKLGCLARCNGADVTMVRPTDSTEQAFREKVIASCSGAANFFVVVSYSRKEYKQVRTHVRTRPTGQLHSGTLVGCFRSV